MLRCMYLLCRGRISPWSHIGKSTILGCFLCSGLVNRTCKPVHSLILLQHTHKKSLYCTLLNTFMTHRTVLPSLHHKNSSWFIHAHLCVSLFHSALYNRHLYRTWLPDHVLHDNRSDFGLRWSLVTWSQIPFWMKVTNRKDQSKVNAS